MKLLLDENLSRRTIPKLQLTYGPDSLIKFAHMQNVWVITFRRRKEETGGLRYLSRVRTANS